MQRYIQISRLFCIFKVFCFSLFLNLVGDLTSSPSFAAFFQPITEKNAFNYGASDLPFVDAANAYNCLQSNSFVKLQLREICIEFFMNAKGRYHRRESALPKKKKVLLLYLRGFEESYFFYLNSHYYYSGVDEKYESAQRMRASRELIDCSKGR